MMKQIIKDRIDKMTKQHIVGKNFLLEDLKEISVIVEDKLEEIRNNWEKRAKKSLIVYALRG